MSKEPIFKLYTRGGQTSFHNIRMWDQITLTLFTICLFLWVVLTGLITWLVTSYEQLEQAVAYYYANFLNLIGQKHTFTLSFHGKNYRQTVETILHYPYYAKNAEQVIRFLGLSALAAFAIAFCIGIALVIYFIRRGKAQTENQFVRGAALVSAASLKKQIIKEKKASDLTIDGLPLLAGSEVQHFLVHGTVGMGKSQFIMKLMDGLRMRGDRVIVYDKGCIFTEVYYDSSRDVILNPFDSRCANWDLWLEAPRDELLENMAESLIPMHGETDPFWVNAARTVFASTASTMRHDPERSLEKLLMLLVTGEFEALEPFLKGTPAATLVSNKIEKTAISIRSVITTYLKSLQSLSGINSSGKSFFSIREYILNPQNAGWLFISTNGEQHKSLKPLISMWIAMASLTLLSLTEDANRRIWFICDELPSLHKLPLLGETIAEVRKFGGCFLLGMQSHSQLTKVYGRSGAAEIFDLLNTRAFFASPSHEMAQLISKELGEEEVEDTRENYSYGANSIRDGISLGKNRVTRPIVTYPEIMGLDPLTCYLRLPGAFPITKLKLEYQKRPLISPGFIQRELPDVFTEQPEESATHTDEPTDNSTRFEYQSNCIKPQPKKMHNEIESIFE